MRGGTDQVLDISSKMREGLPDNHFNVSSSDYHATDHKLHLQTDENLMTNYNLKKSLNITNTCKYDGNEEIGKLETHMQSFFRKEKNKVFIIKVPLDAKIQNKHLTDYYLVRKRPRLMPKVEVEEAEIKPEQVHRRVTSNNR